MYIGLVQENKMSLKKEYVRDGKNRLIGSVTSGFAGDSNVVRDDRGKLLGRTSGQLHTTRDERGGLVSTNTSECRAAD
jgi:hypothetical protein